MYRKLQRRLTLVCALGTGLVLVAMAAFSLAFSVSSLRTQTEEGFDSRLNTIFYYLQSQTVLDQAWLSRMEADGDLLISISLNGRELFFTRQNEQRAALTQAAAELAQIRYGYDPQQRPVNITPELLSFSLKGDDGDYRVAVSSVPYGGGWINLVVLQDRGGERAAVWQMVGAFVGLALLSLLSLAIFAHSFAGRAIRPVQESHEKQAAFVAAASHELRSPLAVLRLGLDRLGKNPAQAPETAVKLQRECDHMSRLVEDMLTLARADEGAWPFAPADASPQTMLLTAYERFEPLAQEKGLGFALEMGAGLPPIIHCDEGSVVQLLSVFLDNALSYTPAGGRVTLSASLEGKELCFAVEDSGPGVPEGEKRAIFDRFYRGDKARSHDGHYGLGLSVAREISNQHGGRIAVEDADGGGARFAFCLRV